MSDTTISVLGVALVTAVFGPIMLAIANRWLTQRRPSEREQLAHDRAALFARVDEQHRECSQALAKANWRIALLVRAMQEAGLQVPDSAWSDVFYDPHTDSYRLRGPVT